MLDDNDGGARTGLWAVLGLVVLLLCGLLGAVVVRHLHKGAVGPGAVQTAVVSGPGLKFAGVRLATPAPVRVLTETVLQADTLVDVDQAGTVAGTLYFEPGSAALKADADAALRAIVDVATEARHKNLLISGFHDAKGDPVQNAALAKQRAVAVREALAARGVDRARMVLRKPEVAVGGGNPATARRVDVNAFE